MALPDGRRSQEEHTVSAVIIIVYLAIVVFEIAALWKVFTKAGQPGWGAIIPIYNTYLQCKIGGKPGWWVILFFIPVVNIVLYIILYIAVARNFGRSGGFAVGLILLPFIFVPILGFGSAQYLGPVPSGQPAY
jgi:hypothetical protein